MYNNLPETKSKKLKEIYYHSVLDILLAPIIIMIQDCSQALNTCKYL